MPLPYPNVSQSATLKKGTTTVKADGGNMIAVKGSEFAVSNGDNPGTLGGVKSSTFMKESTWISYSFDVKMQGRNACRLSDKKFQNHGNTVDLAGTMQQPVLGGTSRADLKELAENCNKVVNNHADKCPDGPTGRDCTTLGTTKHKCCEKAIKAYNEQPRNGPALASEQGFDRNGTPVTEAATAAARRAANQAYDTALATKLAGYSPNMPANLAKKIARKALRKAGTWWSAYRQAGGPAFIADVLVHDPPPPATKANIKKAYDFKFNCADRGVMTRKQEKNYTKYTGVIKPVVLHADGRKC